MSEQVSELFGLLGHLGWKVAVAESCTGGRILDRLTDLPGASGFLLEGIVAYDNESKILRLGVGRQTIVEHGAVSPQVAGEMAEGVRAGLGAEVGVSTTGIAGPTGGRPGKPTGTVHVGVSVPAGTFTRQHLFEGDRESVKEAATTAAIRHLVETLRKGLN